LAKKNLIFENNIDYMYAALKYNSLSDDQKLNQAFYWHHIASEKGYVQGQYNLAVMYYKNQGTIIHKLSKKRKNGSSCVLVSKKAALKNFKSAQDLLSKLRN
jgi:TPR repeat protein